MNPALKNPRQKAERINSQKLVAKVRPIKPGSASVRPTRSIVGACVAYRRRADDNRAEDTADQHQRAERPGVGYTP